MGYQLGDAVILGMDSKTGKPVAVYPEQSSRREHGNFCVLGAPGSGKGLWIKTNLLNWRHSVVVVDLKGDTYKDTARHRSKFSKILVLDPRRGTGNRFNPVAAVGRLNWRQLAYEIMAQGQDTSGEDNFWATSGGSLILSLWEAAEQAKVPHMPFTVQLLRQGLSGLLAYLVQHHKDNSDCMSELAQFVVRDPRKMTAEDLMQPSKLLESKFASVVSAFQPFMNDTMLKVFSGHDLDDIEGFFYEPVTLYVMADETQRQSFSAFLRLVMVALGDSLIKYGDETTFENRRPVLFLFDEFGRVQTPSALSWLDTMRSRGIVLVLFIQKFSQIQQADGRWEDDENSIHHWVIYKPTLSSSRAGQFVVKNSGVRTVLTDGGQGESISAEGYLSQSSNQVFKDRPLVRPEDIEEWPSDMVYYVMNGARTHKGVALGATPWRVWTDVKDVMKPCDFPLPLPAVPHFLKDYDFPTPQEGQGERSKGRGLNFGKRNRDTSQGEPEELDNLDDL